MKRKMPAFVVAVAGRSSKKRRCADARHLHPGAPDREEMPSLRSWFGSDVRAGDPLHPVRAARSTVRPPLPGPPPKFVGRRTEPMTKKPDIKRVLLQTLREELEALRVWQQEPELTEDLANGIAISIGKVEAAIRTAERKQS